MATFDLYAELGAIIDALTAAAVPHAVRGALALAVHGLPRATKDIDIVVPEPSIGPARRVLSASGTVWPRHP